MLKVKAHNFENGTTTDRRTATHTASDRQTDRQAGRQKLRQKEIKVSKNALFKYQSNTYVYTREVEKGKSRKVEKGGDKGKRNNGKQCGSQPPKIRKKNILI